MSFKCEFENKYLLKSDQVSHTFVQNWSDACSKTELCVSQPPLLTILYSSIHLAISTVLSVYTKQTCYAIKEDLQTLPLSPYYFKTCQSLPEWWQVVFWLLALWLLFIFESGNEPLCSVQTSQCQVWLFFNFLKCLVIVGSPCP